MRGAGIHNDGDHHTHPAEIDLPFFLLLLVTQITERFSNEIKEIL